MDSGGKITFKGAHSARVKSKNKSRKNAAYKSKKGKGSYEEFLKVTSLPKETKIKAEDGLSFEAWTKKFERSTNGKKEKSKRQKLTKALDELQVKPGYEWIQELRNRDDVEFREVKLAHKTWKYSTFSLTPAASALIALAVTIATAGTASTIASALVNAASMAVASAGTATATATMVSAVAKVAIATGIKSLASSAAVTLANNKGNIQKTFKDMGRSQFIRGIATAMVVAGATYGISDALGVSTEPATETVKKGTEIGSTATSTVPTLFEEVRDRLVQSSIQTGVATSVQIITEDLKWKDALKQGVINTGVSALGALGANKLSLLYNGGKGSWNYAAHKLGHFALGGAMGAASNYKDPFKGFLSGGTGAMCAEVIMEGLPSTMRMDTRSGITRLLGGTGTFLAGGNVTISDLTATNAIENNSFFNEAVARDSIEREQEWFDAQRDIATTIQQYYEETVNQPNVTNSPTQQVKNWLSDEISTWEDARRNPQSLVDYARAFGHAAIEDLGYVNSAFDWATAGGWSKVGEATHNAALFTGGILGNIYGSITGNEQAGQVLKDGIATAGIFLGSKGSTILKTGSAIQKTSSLTQKSAKVLTKGIASESGHALKVYTAREIAGSSLKSSPIENILTGTTYTSKVRRQMEMGDYHAFPKVVDNYASLGKTEKIIGNDGVSRTKLSIKGGYKGKEGNFEYIIEPDKKINHRKFEPNNN